MSVLAYNVPYKLPLLSYSYTIPAEELRYEIIEDDDDDEDTGPISHFLYPYTPPLPPKAKRTELKNIVTTGNKFLIFIDGSCEVVATVHSFDSAVDRYRVFIEKINFKTGIKTEFMCAIDKLLFRSILNF